jgi:hypothetical protein
MFFIFVGAVILGYPVLALPFKSTFRICKRLFFEVRWGPTGNKSNITEENVSMMMMMIMMVVVVVRNAYRHTVSLW